LKRENVEVICELMKLKPENIKDYIEMHNNTWPELVKAIRKSGFLEEYIYILDNLVIVIMKSNDFKKSDGSGKKQFSAMKQSIFAKKESKTIVFDNVTIAPYPTMDDRKLFKISFFQTYKSPSFASKGEKELYVELNGDKISILAEK